MLFIRFKLFWTDVDFVILDDKLNVHATFVGGGNVCSDGSDNGYIVGIMTFNLCNSNYLGTVV